MSLCSHGHNEALAQEDPTRTATLRKRYAQKLRGKYAGINTVLREAVANRDIFGLSSDALATPPPRFNFGRRDQKVEEFVEWLRQQQENDVLGVISRGDNKYVRHAYRRGAKDAGVRLRQQGVDVPDGVETFIGLPETQEKLQLLYTRNFRALEGITDEVAKQISRELTDGLAAGRGPRDIARDLSDRVDSIGKTRATVMARTEIVRSHAAGTIDRYSREGVGEVVGKAEFSTAGDARVCEICAGLNGNVYELDDARGMIPRHPSCRCAWLPRVN